MKRPCPHYGTRKIVNLYGSCDALLIPQYIISGNMHFIIHEVDSMEVKSSFSVMQLVNCSLKFDVSASMELEIWRYLQISPYFKFSWMQP